MDPSEFERRRKLADEQEQAEIERDRQARERPWEQLPPPPPARPREVPKQTWRSTAYAIVFLLALVAAGGLLLYVLLFAPHGQSSGVCTEVDEAGSCVEWEPA